MRKQLFICDRCGGETEVVASSIFYYVDIREADSHIPTIISELCRDCMEIIKFIISNKELDNTIRASHTFIFSGEEREGEVTLDV